MKPIEEDLKISEATLPSNNSPMIISPEDDKSGQCKIDYQENQRHKYPHIMHFYHPTLRTEEQFEYIRDQVLDKLKIASEQILVDIISTDPINDGTNLELSIASQKIKELSLSMTLFDRSILYCYLNHFDSFKNVVYPPEIDDIRKELSWIRGNFNEYVSELDRQRNKDEIFIEDSVNLNGSPCEVFFDDRFRFSSSQEAQSLGPDDNQKVEERDENIYKNISVFRELLLIDDEMVESSISFFYIKYEKKFSTTNPSMQSLLRKLCYSAEFEAKMIDFCLFFLYCGNQMVSQNNRKDVFPYTKVLNMEKTEDLYRIVALNILDFLRIHIEQNNYLIYQPHIYFTQYRLKSLLNLNLQGVYSDQTASTISLCDVLVNLYNKSLITSDTELADELRGLLYDVFVKQRKFNICDVEDAQHNLRKTRVLTSLSCQKLLKHCKTSIIAENNPDILSYGFNNAVMEARSMMKAVQEVTMLTTNIMKTELKENPENTSSDCMQELFDVQATFVDLEELLSVINSYVSEWILNKDKQTKYNNALKEEAKEDENSKFRSSLKVINNQLTQNRDVVDFMVQMFELSSYILSVNEKPGDEDAWGQTDETPKVKPFTMLVLKICLYFYSLTCVDEVFYKHTIELPKLHSTPSNELVLPMLTKEISVENAEKKFGDIPDFFQSFLELSTRNQFDINMLFIDMCRKHKDNLSELAETENNPENIRRGMSIITRKHPTVFDFSIKKRVLM